SDQAGRESVGSQFWNMRRVDDTAHLPVPTMGAWNQLWASLGVFSVPDNVWRSYSARPYSTQERELAVQAFRRFTEGLPPLFFPGQNNPISPNGLTAEAPFTPARRLELKRTYE